MLSLGILVLIFTTIRYHKMKGDKVFFSIGTDEHGSKIQRRALEEKIEPLEFCTKYSDIFKNLFEKSHIGYD